MVSLDPAVLSAAELAQLADRTVAIVSSAGSAQLTTPVLGSILTLLESLAVQVRDPRAHDDLVATLRRTVESNDMPASLTAARALAAAERTRTPCQDWTSLSAP